MLREEKSVSQLASEYGTHPTMLHKWKKTAVENLPRLFDDDRKATEKDKDHERHVSELYAQIGQLTTQVAWLKKKSGLNPDER